MDDLLLLRDEGLSGAIFGKAFYEGSISLKELENYAH
jgi:phosphoribosylformimino-5-aminoimidazole carboxamide ribonucleotide (ProFAR) isomerase